VGLLQHAHTNGSSKRRKREERAKEVKGEEGRGNERSVLKVEGIRRGLLASIKNKYEALRHSPSHSPSFRPLSPAP
jgi:hypothetical protein